MSTPTSTAEQVRRGRRLVVSAASLMITMSALTILTYTIEIGTHRLPQQAFRFVLTLGLNYALVRGHPWARGLTIVLCALVIMPGILTIQHTKPPVGAVLLIMGLSAIYLGIGAMLLLSPSVVAFFRVREEAPRTPAP